MCRSRFLTFVLPLLLSVVASSQQLRQVAMIDIPGRPGFDQVVFANGMLVIAHQGADTLDIFDPAKRRVIARVEGMSDPHGLAVDARGGKVYVSNTSAKNIAVVSSKDWKLERTIALAAAPFDLTITPDGKRLFVAHWRAQSISTVEIGQGDKVTTAEVGGSPQQMVYESVRNVLFAALEDRSEVAVIDSTLHVASRYKLSASQPTGLVLDTGARRLFVAVRSAVLALNADTGAEVGRVAAPSGADSMWLDAASGTLYLASGGGFVTLIRTAAGSFTAQEEIHTSIRGHSLAVDPGRNLIYMPGGREGRSKLLILRYMPQARVDDPRAQQLANATK